MTTTPDRETLWERLDLVIPTDLPKYLWTEQVKAELSRILADVESAAERRAYGRAAEYLRDRWRKSGSVWAQHLLQGHAEHFDCLAAGLPGGTDAGK